MKPNFDIIPVKSTCQSKPCLDFRLIAQPKELDLLIWLKTKLLVFFSLRLKFCENPSYGKAAETVSLDFRQIAEPYRIIFAKNIRDKRILVILVSRRI